MYYTSDLALAEGLAGDEDSLNFGLLHGAVDGHEHKRHDPGHGLLPDLLCDLDMPYDLIMPCAWILTYPIKETHYLALQFSNQ